MIDESSRLFAAPASRQRTIVDRTDYIFMPHCLSPSNAFLLRLASGALVLIAAAWLLGAIAEEDVVNHDTPLGTIDQNLTEWLHAQATPAWISLMTFFTNLGAPTTVTVVTLVTAIFLSWQRQGYQLLLLVLAVPGSELLNVIIKELIHRHRPVFDNAIQTLASYSFPSGHALGSTVLYGAFAVMFVRQARDRRRSALAIAAATLLIVLICFSRVSLGLHYLSDVVAGFLEGIFWLGSCIVAVEALRHSHAHARHHALAHSDHHREK
jgi:membrane-associated phospholipid phosphatase